jgi:hypothetical protein
MFELTLKFNTKEELLSYLNPSEVKVEEPKLEVPPVIVEAKPKASKKKAQEAPQTFEAPKEEVMEEVPSPFVAPIHHQPATVNGAFNREGAIQKATELVGKLKSSGIPDADLMPAIHSVYEQAGCSVTLKISQLDDVSLSKFIPLFENKVADLTAPKATASFI